MTNPVKAGDARVPIKEWWMSVTASVTRRDYTKGIDSPRLNAVSARGWEAEARIMFDQVPELRYGISWAAASASRAALIAAKVPEHPASPPIPIDEKAREAIPLYDLAATAPQQAQLIRQMSTLLKLVGKWWMVGFNDPLRDGQRRWLVLSDQEYTEVGDQAQFRHPDTGARMRLRKLSHHVDVGDRAATAWVIPMWNPHPMDSSVPDSPVRALIDTLHELVDLSAHVQTAARSRIAGAGLLLMPSSLTPVTPGQATGVNPPEGNRTMRALIRTTQASFRSKHDVSRHTPIIVEGNQEALNAVRHLTLNTPFDDRVDALRTAAVRRIAIGLDIPPEVLSGMGELNHWTAWQVDASGQRVNIAPSLAFICQELTAKYYHPALRAMGVANVDQYMIWYDDSALGNTPNKAEVALQAYELGLLSDESARDSMGYGPADAPVAGFIPPVVKARLSKPDTGAGGVASTEETQVRFPPAAANGWVACADLAALRALSRAGQHLLGAGGRSLRGKYRDTPIHNMHTRVAAGSPDIANDCLRGAFTELREVEPALVKPVAAYVYERLTTQKPHDRDRLVQYLNDTNTQGG